MKRLLVALISLALILFVIWRATRLVTNTPFSATPKTAISPPGTIRPPATQPPLENLDLARELNSPSTDVRADLQAVSELLATYRTNFLHDGNPAGNNAEITAILTGRNKLRIAFISPRHPAINKAGELCDRWGTPFFFHAESGTQMEIRSAGPDKKLYTADDAVQGP